MKTFFLFFLLLFCTSFSDALPGFQPSPYFKENTLSFTFNPEVKVHIIAPPDSMFDRSKNALLIFFALPNGNSTEWTIGKKLEAGDDWHYDIQHIGAQTRFIREKYSGRNVITVYLETVQKSWSTWRAKYGNSPQLIIQLVDSVRQIFAPMKTDVVLNSHSGGGNMTFGFLNGCDSIPEEIERIAFLDSDYAYTDAEYGEKLVRWLKSSDNHALCVLAYNDSAALLNGQPIVSPTGGTWYRSQLMLKRLQQDFAFTESLSVDFRRYKALNGRVQILLKENPMQAILHTVQVELNGFIHSILSGTPFEEDGYTYYGSRAYTKWMQVEVRPPKSFAVVSEGTSALRILMTADPSALSYKIIYGKDGIAFSDSTVVLKNNLLLTGLKKDTLYFLKIRTISPDGISVWSETLAGVPGETMPQVIIVNGFDRASEGNTFNFVRQHAAAFIKNGYSVASATNEAVVSGLVHLSSFTIADYILGDESTIDETFSTAEQETVKTFLRNGGKFFVSGAEIGWDLYSKGTTSDKAFFNQYLKSKFINDTPNGKTGIYYKFEPVPGRIFDGIGVIEYDNGTNGTFNVKYPDVIEGINGGVNGMVYSGVFSNYAAVYFGGLFTGGKQPGRLVTMGVPFETIVGEEKRTALMKKILNFFSSPNGTTDGDAPPPYFFTLQQNFPNPFNPSTSIQFTVPKQGHVSLIVYDVLGREVTVLINASMPAGEYSRSFNAENLPSGAYIYRLRAGGYTAVKKMMIVR